MATYIQPRCYLNNIHALLWLKPCCICPFTSVFGRVRREDNHESYSPTSTRLTSHHLLSLIFSRTRSDSLPLSLSVSVCCTLCSITVTYLSFQGGHGRHAPPCARASRSNQTSCACACTYYAPEQHAHLHESARCTRHLLNHACRVRLGELDVPSEDTKNRPHQKSLPLKSPRTDKEGSGRLACLPRIGNGSGSTCTCLSFEHVIMSCVCLPVFTAYTNAQTNTHTHPHSITASHASTDARAHAHARVHTYRPGRLYCWQQLVSQL